MKQLLLGLLLTGFCVINVAEADQKKPAAKVVTGTISGFECGDNCYLTIVDKQGKEHTGLCSAEPLCEKIMTATGDNLGGYKGKKVKVTVGTGQQVDGSGTVMGTMDAFVKIQLLK